MLDNTQLKNELDVNEIDYTKTGNSFIIDENGSNFILELISRNKQESLLKIYWVEKEPSQRTIDIELRIDNEQTYDRSMNFLIAFLDLPINGEIPMANDVLRDKLEKLFQITLLNNVEKIEISGINPNLQDFDEEDLSPEEVKQALKIGYKEEPMTKQQILDAMDKALEDNDKEAYYKYQTMLNNIKESVSFKYIKKFNDFF